MNVPVGAEILGEQRRKAEAVEALVADLCEGPPDNVSAVLRTALERGWREEVQEALREYESKKQGEISRICNRHYAGFIGSAEELLKMRTDLADLRGQVVDLNEEVQGTGRAALVTARTLLQQRHATANIATTSAVIAQCNGIVSMIMEAFVHIHEERYYSALNTMDSIQTSLRDLDGINFAAQLRCWMPSLTEMINQATKEEMGQWLVDIREASYQIGGAAMRRYAKLHGGVSGPQHSSSADAGDDTYGSPAGAAAATATAGAAAGQPRAALMTFSVRALLRLEELLNCSLRLDDSELNEFVPHFLRGDDPTAQAAEDRALDHLSDYLHPVHRALHIFARLSMLEDFRAWYLEYRRPMAELRSLITRDLDHLDTEGFLTYLPTLTNGIMGFFIVEDALMRKVDHKEGLLSPQQVETAWRRCQVSLRELIERHVSGLSRPGHFLQLKENLLAMAKLATDLDLDRRPLMELLRKLKDPYQRLLLLAFEGDCRRIMQEESFQPLEVQSMAEYEACIVPLGLHEAGSDADAVGGAVDTHYMEVISMDDMYRNPPNSSSSSSSSKGGGFGSNSGFKKRFPAMYPFSATVPELGFALLKLSGLMVSFLSHVEARNAGAVVFSTLERGAAVVKQIMLEQLQSAETDSHILKASQISANSAYISKMPTYLAANLWDCLAALHFADVTADVTTDVATTAPYDGGSPGGSNRLLIGGTASDKYESASFRSLAASGRGLEEISDRARDLIFELVRRKADDLLEGMEFVKWEPTAVRQAPHPYCEDLISYLRVTFMNLSTLPASMREAAHFTCMTHVCDCMLQELLGPRCTAVNILGILNLSRDVAALLAFGDESGIAHLGDCFHKLWHLVDIILKNDSEVILDEHRREREYPRLDVRHLIAVLEKYKNLSLASKIRNTVGDEVPQLEQKRVKQMLSKLREQVH